MYKTTQNRPFNSILQNPLKAIDVKFSLITAIVREIIALPFLSHLTISTRVKYAQYSLCTGMKRINGPRPLQGSKIGHHYPYFNLTSSISWPDT